MWLVALYGFLLGTSVLALVSVAVLGHSIRRGLRLALLLFLPTWLAVNVAFAYAVHRTAYAIESRDPFCVSCHLHESESDRFHDSGTFYTCHPRQRHGEGPIAGLSAHGT